jgi:hypothetical protein
MIQFLKTLFLIIYANMAYHTLIQLLPKDLVNHQIAHFLMIDKEEVRGNMDNVLMDLDDHIYYYQRKFPQLNIQKKNKYLEYQIPTSERKNYFQLSDHNGYKYEFYEMIELFQNQTCPLEELVLKHQLYETELQKLYPDYDISLKIKAFSDGFREVYIRCNTQHTTYLHIKDCLLWTEILLMIKNYISSTDHIQKNRICKEYLARVQADFNPDHFKISVKWNGEYNILVDQTPIYMDVNEFTPVTLELAYDAYRNIIIAEFSEYNYWKKNIHNKENKIKFLKFYFNYKTRQDQRLIIF